MIVWGHHKVSCMPGALLFIEVFGSDFQVSNKLGLCLVVRPHLGSLNKHLALDKHNKHLHLGRHLKCLHLGNRDRRLYLGDSNSKHHHSIRLQVDYLANSNSSLLSFNPNNHNRWLCSTLDSPLKWHQLHQWLCLCPIERFKWVILQDFKSSKWSGSR